MTIEDYKNTLSHLAGAKGRETLPSILVAASECTPLVKTGGLADVVGTLPEALHALGFDVRIILPLHHAIKEKYAQELTHVTDFYIGLGWRRQYVGVESLTLGSVPVYLIDSEFYFGHKIYDEGQFGVEQYAFFCRAILSALPQLEFIPDVIHCNDWHTAAIPLLLRTQYGDTPLENVRTVFTIHNIAFQGWSDMGFLGDVLGIDSKYMTWEHLEMRGSGNLMKAACIFADRVNTVSPSYAQEILTPEYSEGLENVLAFVQNKLSGIVNGIDMRFFDPARDSALPAHFSARRLPGKEKCKAALCAEMGLDGDRPLLAMVTRMTPQKGFDLVLPALERILDLGVSFMLLGTGESRYESAMAAFAQRHPGRVRAVMAYDEALAHRIYAAADLFLMPSRFEPCGISQMLAMRYGALPIVRETGGLRDTVIPYDPATGAGTGFGFTRYDVDDMLGAVERALAVYKDQKTFRKLIRQAMSVDFGFTASAFEYGKLYIDSL